MITLPESWHTLSLIEIRLVGVNARQQCSDVVVSIEVLRRCQTCSVVRQVSDLDDKSLDNLDEDLDKNSISKKHFYY